MKFSTKTIQEMAETLIVEYEQQLEEGEEIRIDELEQEMRKVLQEVGRESLGQMLTIQDEKNGEVRVACTCQAKARRISRREAKLLSVFGWINYKRSYYKCDQCGKTQIPLDEEQGLHPGQATRGMARLLGLSGVTVSFEEASRQIAQYLLVEVCDNTIRKETQEIGKRQQQREVKWIKNSKDIDYLQMRERQKHDRLKRVYGSMDGALVPIGNEWKEEKTISWYQVDIPYGRQSQHAQDICYYTDLTNAENFSELVWASAVYHRVDHAEEVVFVCDGAKWIWKLISLHFPKAVQIVDWYHACAYITPIAEALFQSDEQKSQWEQEMKDFLWNGNVQTVIRICDKYKNHPDAKEPVHKAISYYTNNQSRMDYEFFRQQGYFIGSGTVESACKQIVAMRLKRSGARWTKTGATLTAKARAAWLSNQWDEITGFPLAA